MKDFKAYLGSLDIYKKSFWLYLVLLFLEGVMRRWVTPGLSNFWMICRDPIVIWMVIVALSHNWVKSKVAITFMAIGIITFFTALMFGHHDLPVAIYGARIWIFHMPYIFVMASLLDKRDLNYMIKFLVLMFFISTPIYLLQFFSSPLSFWNRAAGGIESTDSGYGIYGAVRASGLFSHTIGDACFKPVVFSLLLAIYFSKRYKVLLSNFQLVLLFICTAIAMAVGVSRGYVIQSAVTLLFAGFWLLLIGKSGNFIKLLSFIIIGVIVLYIFSHTSIGQRLMGPMLTRFEIASEHEGGAEGIAQSRIFEGFFWFHTKLSLFGEGVGLSSNFAAQRLTGEYSWLLGEFASQMITGEMGIIFGTIICFLRWGFCLYLIPKCHKAATQRNDILPICLWPIFYSMFTTHYNLTMILGVAVVCSILMLVALKPDPVNNTPSEDEEKQPEHKFVPFELHRYTGIKSSNDRQ